MQNSAADTYILQRMSHRAIFFMTDSHGSEMSHDSVASQPQVPEGALLNAGCLPTTKSRWLFYATRAAAGGLLTCKL